MAAFSRSKGAAGEREVCQLLRDAGWPKARRTHDGREQALRGDIANGPAGLHIEVKRSERCNIWQWWDQATADRPDACAPAVVFRRSRSPWLALIELDELLPLWALRDWHG